MLYIRLCLVGLTLLIASTLAIAQGTIRDYLPYAPDMSEDQRAILKSMPQHLDSLSTPYELGAGLTIVQTDGKQHITLRTSTLSTWSLCLLPLVNGTQVLGVIETIDEPIQDSHISFYTQEWEPIESSKLFLGVKAENFIALAPSEEREYLERALYPLYTSYQWEVGDRVQLTIRPTPPLAMTDEQSARIRPLFKQIGSLTYEWDGTTLALR